MAALEVAIQGGMHDCLSKWSWMAGLNPAMVWIRNSEDS
jgi:hypothetical protein